MVHCFQHENSFYSLVCDIQVQLSEKLMSDVLFKKVKIMLYTDAWCSEFDVTFSYLSFFLDMLKFSLETMK